ncbi:lysophospholipase L1-like esterase [Halanaerobium saccharolyticum]|uniref:Lysophospholipase L1-like esterase n=1 Tax=Halanaerobium saccharolyticum TaxID=43595 RepID=A0A4R7YUJ8_9FIRM|nr:rhamnogalacturonan acetylesterase [Halanaerobium saccharolyticum]RAK06888.1 lysophospholipase L1-like esterase [Halanaerobium saccharolyticum]TDW01498.1 lysophospholipase L1-like esterase [Halanaerobium saccharolyticum]TDX52859.1 lysophospholipase L1-like esterase [Halanaerobium saccharolyticum]
MSKKRKIFIAGDSTASNYQESDAPRAGWGQVISNFFVDEIEVINKAASGRSTKSFINENRLNEIEKLISEGDYLFIQFGHNDQKDDPARGTEAFGSFQDNLKAYIKVAKKNGATPILLTPIQRRNFSSSGHLINTHGKYPEAVKKLAHQLNLNLIDLAKITKKYFEELGPKRTKEIFLWLEPGESENYPEGEEDNTHFSKNGALKISELIVEEMRNQNLELSKYIVGK